MSVVNRVSYIIVFAILFNISACDVSKKTDAEAAPVVTNNNKSNLEAIKQQLAFRAESRWKALIKKDIDGAYAYLSPSYRRLHTLESYKSKFSNAIAWDSVKINSIDLDGESAKVKIEIKYPMPFANSSTALSSSSDLISKDLEESWILVDNNWWYVQ